MKSKQAGLNANKREFKAYRLPYTGRRSVFWDFLRLDSLKSALDTSSISRTHPGTFMRPLYLRSWELELNFDVEQERKIAKERIVGNNQRVPFFCRYQHEHI